MQQKGVPDQTALVWRIDIDRLRCELIVMTARWNSRKGIAKGDCDQLKAELERVLNNNRLMLTQQAYEEEVRANLQADLCALTHAAEKAKAELLQWALERWAAEVKNRPMMNVHRRSLDDTWRQVIRYAGGDDLALVGPPHDDILARIKE